MSKTDKDDDAVRRAIRDAMDRQLLGSPIRSDGKLTVKSLAVEADVKRWMLTHQHTDLQEEFRVRCDLQGATPVKQKQFHEKHKLMEQQLEGYKTKLSDLTEENQRLKRVVQVLALENTQLQDMLEKQPGKVRHLR